MDNQKIRWALSDWEDTLNLCKERNIQGIRCTIDILGENTRSKGEAKRNLESYLSIIKKIKKEKLKASLAVKLTAMGAPFDKTLCEDNLGKILKEAGKHMVNVEIDMEGTPLVDYILQTASSFSRQGFPITLALQVYLNRTSLDLKEVLKGRIIVRLVKGAYKGDLEGFDDIQEKFKEAIELLLHSEKIFFVGTHDPELIEWMKETLDRKKEFVEFGFLMGLAEKTKTELVNEGWLVSEYIPFGKEKGA
ncbi:MAG: proline dehydrogenase family protein, partial [Thermoplasmata archaeon]